MKTDRKKEKIKEIKELLRKVNRELHETSCKATANDLENQKEVLIGDLQRLRG